MKEKISLKKIIRDIFNNYIKENQLAFTLTVLSGGLLGVIMAGNTWIRQYFFDEVSMAIGGKGEASIAIALGVAMILVMAAQYGVNAVNECMVKNASFKLKGKLWYLINRKAAKIKAENFEDVDKLDSINKSFVGAEGVSELFISMLGLLTHHLPYLFIMIYYLFRVEPVLCLCVVFSFLPNVINYYIRYKSNLKNEVLEAPLRRQTEYYKACLTDREYFKETRLLGAYGFFREKFDEAIESLHKIQHKRNIKVNLVGMEIRLVSISGNVVISLILLYSLLTGKITVGVFAAVISSVNTLFEVSEVSFQSLSVVSDQLGKIYHYYKYLDIEERGGRQEKPESYQIRFEGVSFSYPGREDKVLYNISLEIKEGETIAIVGENGAGKTTFTKVLLGIFLPGEGEVYFGNKSAKEISQEAYYENASAVFQKYQRYKMTAGENIKISNTDQKDSEKRLKEAIEKAELDLRGRSFSDGENTLLAKEFGGVDLSGGQWQKLAIARGLYRNHSIIVLDEPTAAIDPIEETRVYQKFAEISKGNTSVIVTHRLGSAKIADRILVLDKGRVIEWGTHEELMEKKQKYYSMYQEQAKWYQKDKVKVQVE